MAKRLSKIQLAESIAKTALVATQDLEDSDEVDEIFEIAFDEIEVIYSHRYLTPRTKILKSSEWWENILPSCNDKSFKQELRVTRSDFGKILRAIELDDVFTYRQLPVYHQLAIALSRFGENGNGSSFIKKAAKYAVGEGTVEICTTRVIKALLNIKNEHVKWPTPEEREGICQDMATKLPNCIGYLDGTHVNLEQAPINDPESYFSRKQRYSIQLQGVVDNNKRFIDVNIGYPGSVHDARVFGNSNVNIRSEAYFSGEQWIAADSAYSLSPYVITPFRKNCTSATERERKIFQKYFSKYRVLVENAFGILKGLFQSLKGLRVRVNKENGHLKACNWIYACIVAYNIIMPNEKDYDIDEDLDVDEEDELIDEPDADAEEKRKKLLNWIIANKM